MKKSILLLIMPFLIAFHCNGQTIDDCAFCSEELLTEEQLSDKGLEELSMLRNEIYARKGYLFSNNLYQYYFENQHWYKLANSNDDVKLSDIETKNVALLKSLENKSQKKRDAAIRDLKKLKKAINNNDESTIDKFIHKMKSVDDYESYDNLLQRLKETLNYINLNEIGWNKGKGIYGISIDNGYKIYGYKITFGANRVVIETGDYSHSEIFGDFNDGYSDYMSESEYVYFWIFEMQEEGIVFEMFIVAG